MSYIRTIFFSLVVLVPFANARDHSTEDVHCDTFLRDFPEGREFHGGVSRKDASEFLTRCIDWRGCDSVPKEAALEIGAELGSAGIIAHLLKSRSQMKGDSSFYVLSLRPEILKAVGYLSSAVLIVSAIKMARGFLNDRAFREGIVIAGVAGVTVGLLIAIPTWMSPPSPV